MYVITELPPPKKDHQNLEQNDAKESVYNIAALLRKDKRPLSDVLF